MARGNARQRIVGDDHDRERLLDDLRRTVLRCGWELLAFIFMENHLHLLLKTPRPNLAGACSNSSRRMPSGTDDDIVESGTCSRDGTGPNSSRMRATIGPSAGISTSIRSVLGSSRPGRMAVVELSRLCQAVPPPALGGPRGPAVGLAWRARWNRFSACLPAFRGGRSEESSSSPFRKAFGGWVLGLERFVARLRELAGPVLSDPPLPGARQLAARDPEAILEAVCDHFGLVRSALACAAIRTSLERPPPGSAASTARSRCMNWLPCSASVGPTVSQPDAPHRRGLRSHPRLADDLKEIMAQIGRETKNKV